MAIPVGKLDAEDSTILLNAIGYFINRKRDLDAAVQLLDRFADEVSADPTKTLPVSYYSGIMRAFLDAKDPSAMVKAQSLYTNAMQRYREYPDRHEAPTPYTIVGFLYVCARSNHPEARTWAKEKLEEYEREIGQPPTTVYNEMILVHANAASRIYGAANDAEDCLLYLSGLTNGPSPNVQSFNRTLKAWSVAPEQNGADRAEQILNLLIQVAESHGLVHPDPISFATVISAYANRGNPHRAHEILERAEEYFKDAPDVDLIHCYNATLSAWGKRDSPEAVSRAEWIWARVRDSPSVSVITHTAFMQALARDRQDGPDDAWSHLKAWIQDALDRDDRPRPNSVSFLVVSDGWAKATKRPDKMERLLEILATQLKLAADHGWPCAPDHGAIYSCLRVCTEESTEKAVEVLNLVAKHNLAHDRMYHKVITALCRESSVPSTFKALDLLVELDLFLKNRGLGWDKRSSSLFTAVLASLSRIGTRNAAEKSMLVLQVMRQSNVWISVRAYTSVIFSLSKRGDEVGARLAKDIYTEMKALHETPGNEFTLSILACTAVLESLAGGARSNGIPDFALDVLKDMIVLSKHAGYEDLEPDTRCYDACLRVLLKSGTEAAIQQASRLVEDLLRSHRAGEVRHCPSAGVVSETYRSIRKVAEGNSDFVRRTL